MKSVRKCIHFFIITAFVCFFASEGYALHEVFKSLDLNKDGTVDRNEFSEDMKKEAFSKLDKDQSGEISSEEWESSNDISGLDNPSEVFKSIDKDKNRGITFFEFSGYAERHLNIDEAFMGLDKDGNNSLSPNEMTMRPLFKWITIRF